VALAVAAGAVLVSVACGLPTEGCLRTFEIIGVSQPEGSSHANGEAEYTTFRFLVRSSKCAAKMTMKFGIGAENDQAEAGSDLVDDEKVLVFRKGDMADQPADVRVYPDLTPEQPETFTVCLKPMHPPAGSSPEGSLFSPVPIIGHGTIVNDDGPPPPGSSDPTYVPLELHCSR
jgi:hypothetical protein